MSHIKAKNTKPEVLVRQYLHAAGFRFRIHVKRLPGCPDVVLPKYRTCIFVNGCFWHGHRGCRYATKPKSNSEFWQTKILNNIRRDELSVQTLDAMDWKVITVWECELKKDKRDETLSALAEQIRHNGASYASEQAQRRERNAEHRARLKVALERYEAVMKELGLSRHTYSMSSDPAMMKSITVVAAVIRNSRGEIFATQRGYGEYKDWWEMPGGKAEPGETLEEALRREIMEELDTEISVDGFITTVDYDYPAFHLTMHCYWCSVLSGCLELKEHEAARWLAPDELESVNWLPADLILLPFLRNRMN